MKNSYFFEGIIFRYENNQIASNFGENILKILIKAFISQIK